MVVYEGAGAPLHDEYVQPQPLQQLWWRLLMPYRYKECPDHVIVKGAERTQPSRMGSFAKTEHTHDSRPVYKNRYDQFLWFSRQDGNWLIGPDYTRAERAVQSTTGAGPTSCPADGADWAAIGDSGSLLDKGGLWEFGNITVATQWCGDEGPQLLWRTVARECGNHEHEETITSTLTECARRADGAPNAESGISHLGSFWEDGALRSRTEFEWTPTAKAYVQASKDGVHSKPGRDDVAIELEMVQVAEAQLHQYAQCRRNPDAYIGVPYKQLLEGGGADADGMPKCNEVQQMRGRCEGEPEFHFDYYRTCHGRFDVTPTSWFCTRGINRPTYLNPGLLGIEPTADYAVQPWLPSGIVLASVAFAAYLVASKLAKLGNPRSIIRGDEVIGSLH